MKRSKTRYEIFGYLNASLFDQEGFEVVDTAISEMTKRSKKKQAEYLLIDREFEGPCADGHMRAQALNGHFVWLKNCTLCCGIKRRYDAWADTWSDCETCHGSGVLEV